MAPSKSGSAVLGDDVIEAVFFGPRDAPVAGFVHPAGAEPTGTGIVICPPLLYEQICSYRALRVVAQRLAAAGHASLRFDWPGTGNSAEPRTADIYDAWRDAVPAAVAALHDAAGVKRVVLVALRFGANLAVSALDAGLDVAGVVLWAPFATGRGWLRETRIEQRLATSVFRDADPPAPPLPDGDEEAVGFRLGAGLITRVAALDLKQFDADQWPAQRPRPRVLLSPRDDMPASEAVSEALRARGLDANPRPLPGYPAMMRDPHRSEVPQRAVTDILSWLAALGSSPAAAPKRLASDARWRDASRLVREWPMWFRGEQGRLFGVACQPQPPPDASTWVLLLNAGAVRLAGPNRLWTRLARDWAHHGVQSLRLDGRGVGDSDGFDGPHTTLDELYAPGVVDDIERVLDALREAGAQRFVLVGLCSGAFGAFNVAARRRDIAAIVMINPLALVWNADERDNYQATVVAQSLRRGDRWRRLAKGQIPLGAGLRAVRSLVLVKVRGLTQRGSRRDQPGSPLETMRRIVADGVRVHLVISEADLADTYAERHFGPGAALVGDERFSLHVLRGPDHTFRPLWSQQRLAELITPLVREALGGADAAEASKAPTPADAG